MNRTLATILILLVAGCQPPEPTPTEIAVAVLQEQVAGLDGIIDRVSKLEKRADEPIIKKVLDRLRAEKADEPAPLTEDQFKAVQEVMKLAKRVETAEFDIDKANEVIREHTKQITELLNRPQCCPAPEPKAQVPVQVQATAGKTPAVEQAPPSPTLPKEIKHPKSTTTGGIQEARSKGCDVLLYFTQNKCRQPGYPCYVFEANSLNHPMTQAVLDQNFVFREINIDDEPELAKTYNVPHTPYVIVYDPADSLPNAKIKRIEYPAMNAAGFMNQIGGIYEGRPMGRGLRRK